MTTTDEKLTPEQARLLVQLVQSLGNVERVVLVFKRGMQTGVITAECVKGFPQPKAVA